MIELKTIKPLNKNEYSVLFSEDNTEKTYQFHIDTVIEGQLLTKKNIDKKTLNHLIDFDQFYRGKNDALKKLSKRFYTKAKIIHFLLNLGYPENTATLIIENLQTIKALNDDEMLKNYLDDFLENTDKGPLLLKQKLTIEAFESDAIKEALKVYTKELQLEICRKAITFITPSIQSLPSSKRKQTLARRLTLRGFYSDTIAQCLNELKDTSSDETSNEERLKANVKRYRLRYNLSHPQERQKLLAKLLREGFGYEQIIRAFKEQS